MNLNIIDKLGTEKQEITIAEGKTYTVNCGAKAMIEAQEMFAKDSSLMTMFNVLELLLGKKARKEIYDMNLTLTQLKTINLAIMAQINEVSYEEMEARFQKSTK